jgi:hypothetical protein
MGGPVKEWSKVIMIGPPQNPKNSITVAPTTKQEDASPFFQAHKTVFPSNASGFGVAKRKVTNLES